MELEEIIEKAEWAINVNNLMKEIDENTVYIDREVLENLIDFYKIQRKQLNNAFDNGFIPKDKIEHVIKVIKQYKTDLKEYEAKNIKGGDISCGLVGIKVNEVLELLEGK